VIFVIASFVVRTKHVVSNRSDSPSRARASGILHRSLVFLLLLLLPILSRVVESYRLRSFVRSFVRSFERFCCLCVSVFVCVL